MEAVSSIGQVGNGAKLQYRDMVGVREEVARAAEDMDARHGRGR